jgi:hypothetical protein
MLIVLIAWCCISIVGCVAFLCAAARPLAQETRSEVGTEITVEFKPKKQTKTPKAARNSQPAIGTFTSSVSS